MPTIRAEGARDHDRIALVVTAAFGSTAEAQLVQAIRESDDFLPDLSLVAEVEGQVVGHVMVSHVGLGVGNAHHRIASLAPLAVAPDFQRRGIGSALVREVIERADQRGEALIVLEGSPEYYGRFGFEQSVRSGIQMELPVWAPPEAAQVLRLKTYDPSVVGRVVYLPAFDVVSDE